MVDATALSLLATFVQTVVITLTLLVFIFQFRSQERAIKESSYQNLLGRYNDLMMSWSENEDILIARLVSPGKEFSKQDIATARRLLISYGIIEEAYELYKKRWIDKNAWEQWNTWLKSLCRNPLFNSLHAATAGMYDEDFQAHVTQLLQSVAAAQPE